MENLETEKITHVSDDLTRLLRDAGYLELCACIQCGTCTGSCPSGRRTAHRTRSLMKKVQLGLKEEILSDKELWFCSTCYTCMERCPRGVPVTDVIISLRNLAVKEGYMQVPHIALCKMFYDTGHGVPLNDDKWKKLREYHKLSEIPPTTHQFPESEKEIQILLKSTEFDKLTGVGDYEKQKDEKGE